LQPAPLFLQPTNNLGKSLVGCKNSLYLFPIAQIEFAPYENLQDFEFK
jgi:hypothetical protein